MRLNAPGSPSSSIKSLSSETQFVTRRQIACPDCDGRGTKYRGLISCKRCRSTGQLTEIKWPAGRTLCTICKGWGKVPLLPLALSEELVCCRCEGSGLEPIPVQQNPCPSCSGYGFRILSGLVGLERRTCGVCRGSGQRTQEEGHTEQCQKCDGYGYDRYLGPAHQCHYCQGQGRVPSRKEKPRGNCSTCHGRGYLRKRTIRWDCPSCHGSGQYRPRPRRF